MSTDACANILERVFLMISEHNTDTETNILQDLKKNRQHSFIIDLLLNGSVHIASFCIIENITNHKIKINFRTNFFYIGVTEREQRIRGEMEENNFNSFPYYTKRKKIWILYYFRRAKLSIVQI